MTPLQLCCAVLLLPLIATTAAAPPVCAHFGADATEVCADSLTFTQTLDHFRFSGAPRATWRHRYLQNSQYWGKGIEPLRMPAGCPGPVLMYTGNEGPIDAFWSSNGFMIAHLAPLWGALLLFPEERYYGESQPFGKDSLAPQNAVYLSTEQVLADYALLLTTVKEQLNASTCPVVAFGGSYGGTLTTYFRRQYPALTVGGLAASAPVGYYSHNAWGQHRISEYTWIDIVQQVFSSTEHGGPACFSKLQAIVDAVATAGSTPAGLAKLAGQMHVCAPEVLGKDPIFLLTDALETLPQEDYPYPVGSLPAWPVNTTCATVMAAGSAPTDLLALAANITDTYYGYDGKCLSGEGQGGIPGGGPGPASWGSWSYQSCTETLHQFSSSREGHGFREFKFDMDDAARICQTTFGVVPDTWWSENYFGGYAIGDGLAGITNIIWSNGGLDPWHGGGFLKPVPNAGTASGLHWFFMPEGAHHLDLRGPHPADPANVTATRAAEETIIKGWIEAAAGY